MVEESNPAPALQPEEGESDNGAPVRLPVDVDGFSGPLDLLLHLITKREIDIFSISLAAIADSYLSLIRECETKDLDLAGEYLVLAATLIRFKSRGLLPHEEAEEEEEEEAISDELLRQRQREYERFREAAEQLREREKRISSLFPRLGPTAEQPEEVIEFVEVSVYDLYATFKRILDDIGAGEMPVITSEEFSVDEKMMEVEALLDRESPLLLSAYLRTFVSRMEVIVTFLALLELIRLQIVRARQESRHGEIWLQRGPGGRGMEDEGIEDLTDRPASWQSAEKEHSDGEFENNGDRGAETDH